MVLPERRARRVGPLPALQDETQAERRALRAQPVRMLRAQALQPALEALPLRVEQESLPVAREQLPAAVPRAQRGASQPVPPSVLPQRPVQGPQALELAREVLERPPSVVLPAWVERLRAACGPLWQRLPSPLSPVRLSRRPPLRLRPDHENACGLSPLRRHRSNWSESSFP
jgi:hypothetical protein